MKKPVAAIFDVGKTNKKLFLFDEDYRIVFEKSARFIETVDEDNEPCENLESLRLSVFESLQEVYKQGEFEIKAVNFSAYGASFVYIDSQGRPLTPLYNYLKAYPEELKNQFYNTYGGEDEFSKETASPVLGSLNSGMQLYRLKYEKPEIFKQVKYALHLPQYLSFLITGKAYSDITSIGCHTNLWNFEKNEYHRWVKEEGILDILAPLIPSDTVIPAAVSGENVAAGIGLHDSSAALIPYLVNFHEPFVLISTGTWCISLNPFNTTPLTEEELKQDCLCYMQYKGSPIKASRLFAGFEHEQQVKRIASYFNQNTAKYRNTKFNAVIIEKLQQKHGYDKDPMLGEFSKRDLAAFSSDEEAYHQLILDLVNQQYISTKLVLEGTNVKRIFVDGGFSKNSIYMNMLALLFPDMEIFSASMAQATAIGTALAIHQHWNSKPMPNDIIELKYYAAAHKETL